MVQEREVDVVVEMLDEVERIESVSDTRYSHAVQVLTPIDLLQLVDRMVEDNTRLSRPIIFRRALRAYLNMLEKAGRLDLKPRPKRRSA
jgi:hypothetical protein